MNLLRRLLGAPGHLAFITDQATGVRLAASAQHLKVAGAVATDVHQVCDRFGSVVTTVHYRYHHPDAEHDLRARLHVAAHEARQATRDAS